jgi:hypothetical protein
VHPASFEPCSTPVLAVIDDFLDEVDPALGTVVNAVDAAISRSGTRLDRAVKWKQLVYARDGDFHHWICAVAPSKKKVALRFHFGGLMSDPDAMFGPGTGKFVRSIDYTTETDVDAEVITRYVEEALSRLEHFKANWKQP